MSISSLATMSRLRWLSGGTVAIALAFAALTALPARSADDGEAAAAASVDHEEFVRIRKDDRNRPLAMQTAIQRYTKLDASGAPIVVDLIGVVHVGELDYYKVLNDRFAGYDALLYELVAPEGTRVNPDEARGGPVSGIQTGLKDMLGLEFQLDHIDYHQANFVHADMSPEEFVESMSANDESFMKMFFRAMGSSMAQQGTQGQSDGAMLAAMFSNDREMALRRQMAGQISNMDASMAAFGGENGSTIIHHRNGKCFEILDREIEAGKRMLGVFYGAGHLDDMEERLLAMGYEPAGPREWLVAWRLTRDEDALQAAVSADSEAATDASATNVEEGEDTVQEGATDHSIEAPAARRIRRGAPLLRWRRR